MSQRYPPQGNDNRFPKARSPTRFGERRTSMPHGGFQGRNTDSSYRPADDAPREPPRGPKGLYSEGPRGGGSFSPRVRGGFPRGRGTYDSFSRRDTDRGWSERRDTYDDRRPSPIGRARSRSPPPYRDSRDPPDSVRAFDSPTDHRARGSFSSRGRGGFDRGGRGRPLGSQDRDRFRTRSRSRERFPDEAREDRYDRGDLFRRDDDRYDRGRDPNRRDAPSVRPEARPFDERRRTPSPSATSTASGPHPRPMAADGANVRPRALSDSKRRSSLPIPPQPDFRAREESRQSQAIPNVPSSPPQAPSVPAYGSDASMFAEAAKKTGTNVANARATNENAKIAVTSPGKGLLNAPTGPRADTGATRTDIADPLKVAPKAPKADLAKGPAPQPVRRSMSNNMPAGRPFEAQEPRSATSVTSPQIPSGPRALTRPMVVDTNFNPGYVAGPPSGPRGIPTGPKAMHTPTIASNNVWVRPGGRAPPAGPASDHPAKRDSFGEERARPRSSGSARSQILAASSVLQAPAVTLPVKTEKMSEEISGNVETPAQTLPEHPKEPTSSAEDTKLNVTEPIPESDFALPQSDEEDAVSDDGMSEEDLRAQEAKFQREKVQLESRRPPIDAEDSELLLLLDELDALAVALEDIKEGRWPPPKKEPAEERNSIMSLSNVPALQPPRDASTPPSAPQTEKLEELSDEDEDMENGLPFKRTSPHTPMSQLSLLKEESSAFVAHREQLLESLTVRIKSEHGDAEGLRKEFVRNFLPWREHVEELEKQKQAEEEANAAAEAVTDQQEPAPLPTQSAEASGRGRNRGFMTQLELDQALALSKQTHAEEQARAKEIERDMLTAPDMAKECIIPDMLNPFMQERSQYRDLNNMVEFEKALDVFNFVPPEDNFTEEEQELFKKAYEKNARKQWGHIAKDIPGRTYKDCIMHYYLTKRESKYKRLLMKKSTGRRGRQGRGKTNALLSDLAARPEGDGNGKVEVTDTGRPKRAAAPTNFDRRQQQEVDPTPSRGRGRGKGQVKPGETADSASDKPARGKSGKERGGKRGKVMVPASASGRRPQNADGSSEAPPEEQPRSNAANMEAARSLMDFHASNTMPVIMPTPGHTENWLNPQPVGYQPITQAQIQTQAQRETPDKPPTTGFAEQPVFIAQERINQPVVQSRSDREPPRPANEPGTTPNKKVSMPTAGKPNQSSSYWSVLEQNQVLSWAPILGSNWDEYAARMKAKSAVMVRNYVARLTADGKNPNMTDDINRADKENDDDKGRIDALTAAGKIDAPLGLEQPANLQRPLAPSRKTSGEVKQEREEKPGRVRADSHIAVAPKPISQAASLEASPANRPRVKSNASTKGLAPQTQPPPPLQQHMQAFGPQDGFYDVSSRPKDKPISTGHGEPRSIPAPNTTVPSAQQERPQSAQRAKWSIGDRYTRRENTISSTYATISAGHPHSAQQEEQQRNVASQQAQYAHQSPYSHQEERNQAGNAPRRHETESHTPQIQAAHGMMEDRPSRMPLHVDAVPSPYQPRPQDHQPVQTQSHQSAYSYGREPPRFQSQGHPGMASLMREDSSQRPRDPALSGSHPGPSPSLPPQGRTPSSGPTPTPAPAPAPAVSAKRSNIMSLLNSDDNDPPPPKRITTDSRAPVPVPTPPPSQQTSVPPPPYQSLGQNQYSSRAQVPQQYSAYAESPYSRGRETPPDRQSMQQHPPQHPNGQYEPQRQVHAPAPMQSQHHYNQPPPPSHLAHEHGRSWASPNVQHSHAYPPEQSRYGYTTHASPQPSRPSFAPPPHPQYQSSTPAPPQPQYRAPSPSIHSRNTSLSTSRQHDHSLPPSVYSRGGAPSSVGPPPPPSGMVQHQPGPPNPLLSRPAPQYAGSPLSQEQMRIAREHEDRQRRDAHYPPRDYARTPQSYGHGPPPPHYPPQGR